MYTRKLQATEATTFDYTAPATGEYTWRMRSSSIGATTTQPITYSLDNLSIFYTYPYTVENCDNLADGYRYGFNTQEKDDEVYGAGNLNTAEFWEYDTRLGRRWNVDPIVKVFESPYATFGNNPIWFSDVKGDDTIISSSVKGQSEIKNTSDLPAAAPPGVKLQSESIIDIEIRKGQLNYVNAWVKPTEFTSDIIPGFWEMSPAFTAVQNKTVDISQDKKTATVKYDVVTSISNFEAMGQAVISAVRPPKDAKIQTNIITIVQSVTIQIDISTKTPHITYTIDGSSFPSHDYKVTTHVTYPKEKFHSFNISMPQSKYNDAIDAKKFKERNNRSKTKKTITF